MKKCSCGHNTLLPPNPLCGNSSFFTLFLIDDVTPKIVQTGGRCSPGTGSEKNKTYNGCTAVSYHVVFVTSQITKTVSSAICVLRDR